MFVTPLGNTIFFRISVYINSVAPLGYSIFFCSRNGNDELMPDGHSIFFRVAIAVGIDFMCQTPRRCNEYSKAMPRKQFLELFLQRDLPRK